MNDDGIKQTEQYEDEDYISPSQAAEVINVSRTTINYWIRKYNLKAKTSPGGRYKILYKDFKVFLKFYGKNQGIRIKKHNPKYKIAIIEPSKHTRENYENWLSDEYSVKSINNVAKPMKELKKFAPNIIIFEVLLDNHIDGFVLLDEIKNEISLNSAIVFIVSKRYDESDVVRGFELGARDYVKKPIGKSELQVRLKNILRNIIDL